MIILNENVQKGELTARILKGELDGWVEGIDESNELTKSVNFIDSEHKYVIESFVGKRFVRTVMAGNCCSNALMISMGGVTLVPMAVLNFCKKWEPRNLLCFRMNLMILNRYEISPSSELFFM